MSLSSAKPSLASRRQAPAAADVPRVPNHRRINLAPGHLAHLELLPLRVAACPSAHGIVLLARCNRSSWAGARACAQPLFPAGRHGRSHTRVLPSVSVAQCPHARLLPLVSTAARRHARALLSITVAACLHTRVLRPGTTPPAILSSRQFPVSSSCRPSSWNMMVSIDPWGDGAFAANTHTRCSTVCLNR